ncbi:MAG: SDR family NAD(P)-dependent oxidoreductase [Bacteroidetes bacterium]|nr:SDR family NAD(P)-dependent oxidoreductase [Bacteroidota bacterium]
MPHPGTKMKQSIIITGSAGGLGQAIVRALLDTFPDKLIVATDVSPAVFSLFKEHDGLIPLQMDVSNEQSTHAVRRQLEEKGFRVWALVNNAGISDFYAVSEKEKEVLDRIFAINTFGPVNMVRAFLPHLMETRGRVVQISSESVRLPGAFQAYSSSKIAMEALSVAMRNELALQRIKLSIIRPGAINTPLLDGLRNMKDSIGESVYQKYLLAFAEKAPKQIGKLCEPERVAAVVVKALSQQNPRFYYKVNNNWKLRLAELLPHRWRDYFMRKMLAKSAECRVPSAK